MSGVLHLNTLTTISMPEQYYSIIARLLLIVAFVGRQCHLLLSISGHHIENVLPRLAPGFRESLEKGPLDEKKHQLVDVTRWKPKLGSLTG